MKVTIRILENNKPRTVVVKVGSYCLCPVAQAFMNYRELLSKSHERGARTLLLLGGSA